MSSAGTRKRSESKSFGTPREIRQAGLNPNILLFHPEQQTLLPHSYPLFYCCGRRYGKSTGKQKTAQGQKSLAKCNGTASSNRSLRLTGDAKVAPVTSASRQSPFSFSFPLPPFTPSTHQARTSSLPPPDTTKVDFSEASGERLWSELLPPPYVPTASAPTEDSWKGSVWTTFA